jgi:hypothetical protein
MEGQNTNNPASHCDIAWGGALATEAQYAALFRRRSSRFRTLLTLPRRTAVER